MQNIRQVAEQREVEFLSPFAALSSKSQGRLKREEECTIRTCFQHDRDRIIHSRAFRRLKHKTQVFISPAGDHYRTRLTHTLEVAQIARTIARALSLNEDLTEAIALGHDLGHTPFGHAGENVLNNLLKKYGMTFDHNVQSLHIVDNIEKLNLTFEVRDGIINHPWTFPWAKTLEGRIVRFADRIAYINHDIDDAIRSNILKKSDIPKQFADFIGKSPIDAFVKDIVEHSLGKNDVKMSKKGLDSLLGLYKFMFKHVYMGKHLKEQHKKVEHLITSLFNYYLEHPYEIPNFKQDKSNNLKAKLSAIRDYIAGMTDRFAIETFNNIFVPKEWQE